MAGALVSQGQLSEARKLLKDAITHGQALHESYPDNPRYPSFIVPLKYGVVVDMDLDDENGRDSEDADRHR
jgi:hypothetical protein